MGAIGQMAADEPRRPRRGGLLLQIWAALSALALIAAIGVIIRGSAPAQARQHREVPARPTAAPRASAGGGPARPAGGDPNLRGEFAPMATPHLAARRRAHPPRVARAVRATAAAQPEVARAPRAAPSTTSPTAPGSTGGTTPVVTPTHSTAPAVVPAHPLNVAPAASSRKPTVVRAHPLG